MTPDDIPSRLYRRLGPRYLDVVMPFVLSGGVLVGAGGLVTLALYIDVSAGQFLLLLAVVQLEFWLIDILVAVRFARRHLEPVQVWLDGERNERSAMTAWRAAASLPLELLRYRLFYLLVAILAPVFDVFAVQLLDLPWYTNAILLLGNGLTYTYWVVLRFLGTERALRPVLADIAETLSDEVEVSAVRVPLRVRLLAALPALVVITGAIAPGVASQVNGDVARLGAGMVAAFLVASTIAVPLIQLLSDSVVSPIRTLEEATRRVGAGDLEVRVPVVSTDESGTLARSFNQMVAGLAERERLRETFGAYVDPEIAEHILKHGTNLGGEQVEVTMMFLDVRDFTGFAEREDAEVVVAELNRLWEAVVPVIHEHGGHVDKFVGDGLLAVFGAPRRHDDHADQAVAAALEMVERVRPLRLEIGIGINSGSVVAGNVGGAGRLEFSVIGDAVNVAARVEAATRQTGDQILITDATRRLLRAQRGVEMQAREGIPLKGKTEQVALFAPRPATSAASAARRPA